MHQPEAIVLGCPTGFPAPNVDLGSVQRLPEVSSSALMYFTLTNVADQQGQAKDAMAKKQKGPEPEAAQAEAKEQVADDRAPQQEQPAPQQKAPARR